jgi:hypothetical protein
VVVALRRGLDISKYERVAARVEHGHDAPKTLDGGRMGQEGNQDLDDVRPASLETLCQGTRVVVEVPDGVLNMGAGFLRDARAVVEHARHGPQADTGPLGNIGDGHHARESLSPRTPN